MALHKFMNQLKAYIDSNLTSFYIPAIIDALRYFIGGTVLDKLFYLLL